MYMKILVLDKDVTERAAIQQVLQHNGHEIMSAEDTETAMRLLQDGDLRFVIADRVTTDMDEKQFIQRVRDAKPPFYIYILLLTDKVQETDIIAPRIGADDYLHNRSFPLNSSRVCRLGNASLNWAIIWWLQKTPWTGSQCSIRSRVC